MRIEQGSAGVNMTSATNTGKSRMDSAASVQIKDNSVKKEVQDKSTVQKMEQYQKETLTATDETSEEQETDVIRAIEQANTQIKSYGRKLEFAIHDETKQIMVKVINTDDDSIIREVPSEKVLDMVARMWDMSGIIVDEKR